MAVTKGATRTVDVALYDEIENVFFG
jgi:hypothetical protein